MACDACDAHDAAAAVRLRREIPDQHTLAARPKAQGTPVIQASKPETAGGQRQPGTQPEGSAAGIIFICPCSPRASVGNKYGETLSLFQDPEHPVARIAEGLVRPGTTVYWNPDVDLVFITTT